MITYTYLIKIVGYDDYQNYFCHSLKNFFKKFFSLFRNDEMIFIRIFSWKLNSIFGSDDSEVVQRMNVVLLIKKLIQFIINSD